MNHKQVLYITFAILGLVAVFATALIAWDRWHPARQSAIGEAPGSAESITTPAGAARESGDPHGRRLIRIKQQPDHRLWQAYISYRGGNNPYKLGAKLPPDSAVLLQVETERVLLELPSGATVILPLEKMSEADRAFFTEPAVIESVDDLPEPVPDDPVHQKMLDDLNNPDAPCAQIKDDEARRSCERRLHAEMSDRTAECDDKDTAEEAVRCYDEIEKEFEGRPPVQE